MDITRSRWRRSFVAGALLVGLSLLAWSTLASLAQGGGSIGFGAPHPAQVGTGDPPTWVEIVLTGTEVYGYQFKLHFDPAMLEAVDSEFVDSFVKAELTPPGWSGTIDNVAGTVLFAATQLYPTPPASGSGVVARVAFRGRWNADLPDYTALEIRQASVANKEGMKEDLSDAFHWVLILVPVNITAEVKGECGPGWLPGECLSTTLTLSGQNLYGYQYRVAFDPALLQASGAGFYDAFLKADYRPPGWAATIDNVAGQVRFAATQQYPEPPATGSGSVGWICFHQVDGLTGPQTTTVEVAGVLASTKDGVGMIGEGIADTITLQPIVTVYGQVQMQGRSEFTRCVASALGTLVTDVSDKEGWYTLTLCSGVYTVALEMERYLDTWRSVNASLGQVLLPTVQLLGGDCDPTDDDVVDIADLSTIGSKYGQQVGSLTENADINADGWVDILDIAIAGGNYMKESPVPWP